MRDPRVNIEKPVKVIIEITGEDLDTCLYGMDDIREHMSTGKTSGAVRVAHAESYKFTVENLGAENE